MRAYCNIGRRRAAQGDDDAFHHHNFGTLAADRFPEGKISSFSQRFLSKFHHVCVFAANAGAATELPTLLWNFFDGKKYWIIRG